MQLPAVLFQASPGKFVRLFAGNPLWPSPHFCVHRIDSPGHAGVPPLLSAPPPMLSLEGWSTFLGEGEGACSEWTRPIPVCTSSGRGPNKLSHTLKFAPRGRLPPPSQAPNTFEMMHSWLSRSTGRRQASVCTTGTIGCRRGTFIRAPQSSFRTDSSALRHQPA